MMHTLALRPSAWLRRLQWLVIFATLAVAGWLAASGHPWAAAAAALCAWPAARVRQGVKELRLRSDGFCEADAILMRVTARFGGAGWQVLRLAGQGRRVVRMLVLAPDAAASEDLRRLRVWLRWAAQRSDLNSRRA